MAQTPAKRRSQGDHIDYTPSSAVAAGAVIVAQDSILVAERAIPANTLGAVAVTGVFEMPKTNEVINAGAIVYWDPAGNPYGGDAGSGAITPTAGTLKRAGKAVVSQTSWGATTGTIPIRINV